MVSLYLKGLVFGYKPQGIRQSGETLGSSDRRLPLMGYLKKGGLPNGRRRFLPSLRGQRVSTPQLFMTISKEITHLEHSAVKLDVTIGKDDVRSEYDDIISEYRKNIKIPGFRPGKVPRDVLERKLGKDLLAEVKARVIERVIKNIFDDETFPKAEQPLSYSTPKIDDDTLKAGPLNLDADFSFSMQYDILPSVPVERWTGFEVEVPDVSITDEDINRELEVIRERNAVVYDKDESAPAETGDVITVSYCEVSEAGEVVQDTNYEDYVFTLGTGSNKYKFDGDLVGMKREETREFEKTYPENFENKDLAGKTKKLRVKMLTIKEKKLPDLNDDFAQDVDEQYHTIDDLRGSIRNRFEKELGDQIRVLKTNTILEKIMEMAPVDLPESMIRIQLQSRWRNVASRLKFPADSDLFEDDSGKDAAIKELVRSWRPEVIQQLHSGLVADSIIQKLSLEVSDKEVVHEIECIAQDTKSPFEETLAYYKQESRQELLKEELKERKLLDILLAENTFKPGKKQNFLEFTRKDK
jgi:trigger factor